MSRLQQASKIAYGKNPSEGIVVAEAIVAHSRIVIRASYPLKAHIAVGSYASGHVGLSIVVERHRKVVRRAAYIAEMNEKHLLLFPEMANNRGKIIGHQGEIALTEAYSI